MNPLVMDVNVETGEIVEREMTESEYADYLNRQKEAEEQITNGETL